MKYFQIFRISWQDAFVYRLNFIMWRVRTVLQFFAVYFLWIAIFTNQSEIFDYSKSIMLTYIIGTSVLRTFVFSSRSTYVGAEIANGDLNNYLVKPINYLKSWLSRDLADKLLNILFLSVELFIFILIIKPPLVLQRSWLLISTFILATILAIIMYFLFSFIVSSFAFWYPEHNGWPLRFFVFMIIEFIAGGLFPLDILPTAAFNIIRYLPPAYLVFYPVQIYLGRLNPVQIYATLLIMLIWIAVLYKLSRLIWKKGLKTYGAYGR